ncbi:MAG: branched-chain amino acid ABC transporter permease [Candidatus Gerdarchaeota archaeon]|nr:MAG: branched-chain amino acid ABC transporter permease [Desulfobacteraceae bacterium 4484_190.3]RLI65324.1 MAG: branched-chain amino acid ABC transporter permease [Candidatus Gerdarchaeota archaeon]
MDLLVYLLDLIVLIGIFGIFSLSLNLEFGFAGLANFGKVAFVLVGAYTYYLLSEINIPFYFCLLAGAIASAIVGFIVSLPTLKLREDYLAIVVLSFGEILKLIVKSEGWIAGGVWGTPVLPAISVGDASTRIDALVNIGLVYFCLGICFVVVEMLTNSPYGRVMRAIREDELAAETLGKNKKRYRAQIFALGSAIAGLGGGLYAQYIQFIDPYMFVPMLTFTVWIMVLVGGPGNNWGALLGAVLVMIFDRGANIAKDYLTLPVDPSNLQYIIFGILIILILLYRPQGMLKESQIRTKARDRIGHDRTTAEAEKS